MNVATTRDADIWVAREHGSRSSSSQRSSEQRFRNDFGPQWILTGDEGDQLLLDQNLQVGQTPPDMRAIVERRTELVERGGVAGQRRSRQPLELR